MMPKTKKSLVISVTLALLGGAIAASSIGCSAPYVVSAEDDNAKSSGDTKGSKTTTSTTTTTNTPAPPPASTPVQSIPVTPPVVDAGGPNVNDTCVGCPSGFTCSAGRCVAQPPTSSKCGVPNGVTCPAGSVCATSTGQCVQSTPRTNTTNDACFDQCINDTSFEAADYIQCSTINCGGVPGLCDDTCFAQTCGGIENVCEQAIQNCDARCGF